MAARNEMRLELWFGDINMIRLKEARLGAFVKLKCDVFFFSDCNSTVRLNHILFQKTEKQSPTACVIPSTKQSIPTSNYFFT